MVLFINITAEEFCAWLEAEDFETPPEVEETPASGLQASERA